MFLEVGTVMPDGLVGLLDVVWSVQVRHQQGVVPCLVADAQQVGVRLDQVGDPGILERVELVVGREMQVLPDIVRPVVREYLVAALAGAGAHLVREQVVAVGVAEDVQLHHQLQDFVRECDGAVLAVLARVVRDEDGAALD